MAALDKACKSFKPFPHCRSCLVVESADKVFKGIVGGYGKIKGATAFVAFIGDMGSPHVQEETGYTGEGIILEATALGLGTCWVGGFFRPEAVARLIPVRDNERVLAVTPVGYASSCESTEERLMSGFGRNHRRLPATRMVTSPQPEVLPAWAREAIEAARVAPSAINRQPWAFTVDDDSITVSVRTRGPEYTVSKRLDCGIAMLHIEIAALSHGMQGNWEFLGAPNVGRFVAAPRTISV